MLGTILLPRQFQVVVVENVNESHLNKAIWLFPLYLLLFNIFVLPIALGGLLDFADQPVNPDTFVLMLPLSEGWRVLALLVFLGGFSAATGMVIVESIALPRPSSRRRCWAASIGRKRSAPVRWPGW
jgi:Na+/proline symporter